jgi:hypothetical protein
MSAGALAVQTGLYHGFSQSPQEQLLTSDHVRLLPHPFPFIINDHSTIPLLHRLRAEQLFAAGLRQHSHSLFQAPSGPMATYFLDIYVF